MYIWGVTIGQPLDAQPAGLPLLFIHTRFGSVSRRQAEGFQCVQPPRCCPRGDRQVAGRRFCPSSAPSLFWPVPVPRVTGYGVKGMRQRPLGSSTAVMGASWPGGGTTLISASLRGSEMLLLGGEQDPRKRRRGAPSGLSMGLVRAAGSSLGRVKTWRAIPWPPSSVPSSRRGSVSLITNTPSGPSRCQERGQGLQTFALVNGIYFWRRQDRINPGYIGANSTTAKGVERSQGKFQGGNVCKGVGLGTKKRGVPGSGRSLCKGPGVEKRP